MSENCLSCIDGRTTDVILGCPGGDAGALLRCIFACKLVCPEASFLNDEQKYLEIIKETSKQLQHPLYYHTDDHSLHGFDPKTVQNLDEAVKGENIGCGYLKLCCVAPHELEEDENLSNLTKTYIKSLVKGYQENSDLFNYVVLQGGHQETEVKLHNHKKPVQANGKTFIYHPNAEIDTGKIILDAICTAAPEVTPKKEEISKKYQEICKHHWEKTINFLAPGKEIQVIE